MCLCGCMSVLFVEGPAVSHTAAQNKPATYQRSQEYAKINHSATTLQ